MASTQRPYAVLSSVRSTLSNCGNRHPVSPAIRGPDRTRLGAAAIAKAPPYRHRLDSDECPSASEMRPSVPAVRSRMRSGRTCAPTQPLGTMLQDHWVPKGAVPPAQHLEAAVPRAPVTCPLPARRPRGRPDTERSRRSHFAHARPASPAPTQRQTPPASAAEDPERDSAIHELVAQHLCEGDQLIALRSQHGDLVW
jgi:hypothetical protein